MAACKLDIGMLVFCCFVACILALAKTLREISLKFLYTCFKRGVKALGNTAECCQADFKKGKCLLWMT